MKSAVERSRRDVVVNAGVVATGGLLTGCLGDSTEEGGNEGETPTGEGYTVTMEPVGEVEFDSVPGDWATYFPSYADMGIALGKSDGLLSVGVKSRFYTKWYDEVEGVGVDKEPLTELYDNGIDEEIFYEMEADVHVIDPNWLLHNFDGWDETGVERIRDNVAPFVGNVIFRQTDPWHDYRYYTMYEAFEKVAEVFQKQERYNAFKELHDDYISEISTDLPDESERPNAVLSFAGDDEPEEFAPTLFETGGTNIKHWRDLGVTDALADTDVEGFSSTNRQKIDYEKLLEVDPDVLLVRGHEAKTRAEFEDTVVAFMEQHPVASDLSAVENKRVFRGGPVYQGPIHNLFLTERGAQQLYPDVFGEADSDRELFDRGRVAEIVNGGA